MLNRLRRHRAKNKVLGWINSLLLPGPPLERLPRAVDDEFASHGCPVGQALTRRTGFPAYSAPNNTWINSLDLDHEGYRIAHPAFVKEFISDFDAGKYPELEADCGCL